jgi:hypothetical protein
VLQEEEDDEEEEEPKVKSFGKESRSKRHHTTSVLFLFSEHFFIPFSGDQKRVLLTRQHPSNSNRAWLNS